MFAADVYVSVTGGLTVNEPAADLGASSRPWSPGDGELRCPPGTVFLGEVGLSGEVRPVHQAGVRLREGGASGVPPRGDAPGEGATPPSGRRTIDLVAVETLDAALAAMGQA